MPAGRGGDRSRCIGDTLLLNQSRRFRHLTNTSTKEINHATHQRCTTSVAAWHQYNACAGHGCRWWWSGRRWKRWKRRSRRREATCRRVSIHESRAIGRSRQSSNCRTTRSPVIRIEPMATVCARHSYTTRCEHLATEEQIRLVVAGMKRMGCRKTAAVFRAPDECHAAQSCLQPLLYRS